MVFVKSCISINALRYCNNLIKFRLKHNLHNIRSFNSTAPSFVKMFMENENKHAFNIMEQNGYPISIRNDTNKMPILEPISDNFVEKKWTNETPQNLFRTLSNLGEYCCANNLCISNECFDDFIDNLTDNIKFATNEELISLFFAVARIPETESIRTRNYIEIWAALDDECIRRINKMNFDEMLYFVSLFYLLNVTRYSDFSFKCFQKLASKAKKLTKAQLVQTMFYIGVKRFPPDDMHNLEVCIEDTFQSFNIDELAVISMGFFKSKTPIRSMTLVTKIIDKLIENSSKIHEVSLAALLKVIRYSMKILVDNKIYDLLDCLKHQVSRLSIMCNVHIALVGTATLTLHEECLNAIAEKTLNSFEETRLKDIERLVLTFGTFNFVPKTKECFTAKVVHELNKPEREAEIRKHGVPFACCVAYLGLLGVYPEDLMNKVLNPDFLAETYGKHCLKYGREILTIHNLAKIFCKNPEMYSLQDNEAVLLAKKFTDYVPDENYNKKYNAAEKMFLDVKYILQESRGGKEYVTGFHLITHHQRGDIIICNSLNGSAVPVKNTFPEQKFGLLWSPPDDNKWIVLVIAGRNTMLQTDSGTTGHITSKVRELNALGFYADIVNWTIYNNCQSFKEKKFYLNSVIENALNKNKNV